MVVKALSGLINTYLSDDSPEKKPPTNRLVLTLVLAGVLAGLHILFWVMRLNGALRRCCLHPHLCTPTPLHFIRIARFSGNHADILPKWHSLPC